MSKRSILVVGATGQLGARLLRKLSSLGVHPRALVRSHDKGQAIASLATPVIGDLTRPETLGGAFRAADHVFIVAPPIPEMETIERNAIDAAVAGGAKRMVYLSNFTATEGSELRPMHIHGFHERVIASLGIEWTVLGPTRYMTNLPFNWRSVLNDDLLLEPHSAGTITCIDPDDVATIAAKALTEDGHQGRTYRVTSHDAFTAATLAALLGEVLGRPIRVVDPADPRAPARIGYFGLVDAGAYKVTDTAGVLLGHAPRTYRQWLEQHLPALRAG